MSQDFKIQLQAFVNEAAEKYSEKGLIGDWSMQGNFKQGCDLLIPVLMRAIEQKDFYLKDARDEYDQKLAKETDNKELLNILKGENET